MELFIDSGSGKVCCEASLLPGHSIAVLTHGYLSNKMSRTNSALIPILNEKGISTLAFDMYGHGKSEGDPEHLTVSKVVDNMLAAYDFARKKGYLKIGLAASSFSGSPALISASKRDFAALVLRCPVFDGKQLWDERLGEEGLAIWRKQGFISPFGRKWHFEAYEDESKYDMRAIAREVRSPTLVIHGDKDRTVPISQARDLISGVGGEKRLAVVEGADHFFDGPGHFGKMLGESSAWLLKYLA